MCTEKMLGMFLGNCKKVSLPLFCYIFNKFQKNSKQYWINFTKLIGKPCLFKLKINCPVTNLVICRTTNYRRTYFYESSYYTKLVKFMEILPMNSSDLRKTKKKSFSNENLFAHVHLQNLLVELSTTWSYLLNNDSDS